MRTSPAGQRGAIADQIRRGLSPDEHRVGAVVAADTAVLGAAGVDAARRRLAAEVLGAGPLEPFDLTLDRVQTFFVLRFDLTLRSPVVPNFERGFSAGRLRLSRVELADGSVLTPPAVDPASPTTARSR